MIIKILCSKCGELFIIESPPIDTYTCFECKKIVDQEELDRLAQQEHVEKPRRLYR